MEDFKHCPVLLHEAVDGLCIKPDGVYVDGTAGGGGHSFEIASRLSGGKLICVDQDSDAISAVKQRLSSFGDSVEYIHDNFENLKVFLVGRRIDGMLLDLGVSSYQLDTAQRGFSYIKDAPLDMRMNRDSEFDCKKLVNEYDVNELTRVLRDWGEERFAHRIAQKIAERREQKEIESTGELAEIIKSAIPASSRGTEAHPEKRSFQAFRIEVNRELEIIRPTLEAAVDIMNPGGRLCVITFRSLEDRIVKQCFAEMAKGCVCPPEFPVCVCNRVPLGKVITKKPILPGQKEQEENSRSKSAKLRIFEKI